MTKWAVGFRTILLMGLLSCDAVCGQRLRSVRSSCSPAWTVSGLTVLGQFPTFDRLRCMGACGTRPSCWGTDLDRVNGICYLLGYDVYSLADSPAGGGLAPVRRCKILARTGYCTAPPSPRKNAIYTTSTAGMFQSPVGTKIGYTCQRGSAFHSQDLVALRLTATSTASDAERFRTFDIQCTSDGTWSPSLAALPRCSEFIECKKTSKGKDYYGTSVRVSETGLPCLPWATQTLDPTPALKNADSFPADMTVARASNYCRNPLVLQRPFCIVQGSPVRQYCNVSDCEDPRPFECMWKQLGNDYMGARTKTVNGRTCQAWNVNSPWTPTAIIVAMLPDDSSAHNKCRNGDNYDPRPWCYTTSTNSAYRWEFCDVRYCPGFP